MVIHLATDHAGFGHKEVVAEWLRSEQFEVIDHGAHVLDENDDFPDYISQAIEALLAGDAEDRAIIFGGSGQGEAMLANRYPGVRAVVFYGGYESMPALTRQHNDSNVLSIGARFCDINTTKRVTWEWLFTQAFLEEKYQRRNYKIEEIAKKITI